MKLPISLACLLSLSACMPPANNDAIGGNIPGASASAADKERYFAEQLPILQARNPEADARAAIARGDRHFLCNAGRSDTVPGLNVGVYAQVRNNCPTRCMEGVTDALYGPNHNRYLQAALAYSARWNQTMLAACR